MNEYQFGKHLEFEEVLKDKGHYAKIFSEGSSTLEKLLMRCFDEHIETYMCCIGHEEGDAPFIMLYIPYSDKELIYNIIDSIYDLDGVIIRLGKEHDTQKLLVDIKSYSSDYFFRPMYNGVSKGYKSKKLYQDIITEIEILNRFYHESYDLYFETSKYNGNRLYTLYANYISMGEFGPVKHHAILRESLDYNTIINTKESFSEKRLNQAEQKIIQDNDLERQSFKEIEREQQKIKTILH